MVASSHADDFVPENVVDENIKSYWLSGSSGKGEWLEIDLERPGKVYAIQINYQDHDSKMFGRIPGLYHRYTIEGSIDGNIWEVLIDRSNNYRDVPNDYVELAVPARVRYVRFNNIHVPTPELAISDLRIFGTGEGKIPAPVKKVQVNRKTDRRDVHISWEPLFGVQGYNVYWGIAPDKMYSSWLVYDKAELEMKNLNVDQEYWFEVEAFNENGVSKRSKRIKAD